MKSAYTYAFYDVIILSVSSVIFSHVLHVCFTGTGATQVCPSAKEEILKDMGQIDLNLTTLKLYSMGAHLMITGTYTDGFA